MKFDIDDRVRIVSAESNFWWWEGVIVAKFDGDLMDGDLRTGIVQYQVRFTFSNSFRMPPLLFKEMELAYS